MRSRPKVVDEVHHRAPRPGDHEIDGLLVKSRLVESERSTAVEQALHQVAGWLLPGASPVDPVHEAIAPDLVVRARSARMLGPLLAVVDSGGLDLTAEGLVAARAQHEAAMLWCMHVETQLLHIRRWLKQAGGLPHLVVKGPAVAHLDDLDPSLRAFADLDLLVPAEHLTGVIEVLVAHGGHRADEERRAGFVERCV